MRRGEQIRDLQTQRALLRLDLKTLRGRREQLAFSWESECGDQTDQLIDMLHNVTRSLIAAGSN